MEEIFIPVENITLPGHNTMIKTQELLGARTCIRIEEDDDNMNKRLQLRTCDVSGADCLSFMVISTIPVQQQHKTLHQQEMYKIPMEIDDSPSAADDADFEVFMPSG